MKANGARKRRTGQTRIRARILLLLIVLLLGSGGVTLFFAGGLHINNVVPPAAVPMIGDASRVTELQTVVIPPDSMVASLHDPCHGYDGVLLIQQGDRSGAAATIFFLFVLNQLIYAEKYNLLPWIHLNDYSHWIYDPQQHGNEGALLNQTTTVQLLQGMQPSRATLVDPTTAKAFVYPGRPVQRAPQLRPQNVTVTGTGVWNSYFEPVSNFTPTTTTLQQCRDKPLITLPANMILPALHIHCPWSVRAWRYGGLPLVLQENEKTLHDWLGNHRRRGAAVVQKYYRWNDAVNDAAVASNPSDACLALHVRHSDKGNRRRRIPLSSFLPYVKAYTELTGGRVYLATDSSSVLSKINATWPASVVGQLYTLDSNSNGKNAVIVRSSNKTAVFKLGHHDQTNFQVLTDIAAMSRCQFFLHGLSAVSEAVHYWNPVLHEQSVNLDDPQHMSVQDFEQLVRNIHRVTN